MTNRDDLRYVPVLGLALGGGGALGAAHVGVLQVLAERGIVPTVVAGTSAGAVIGAAFAAGMDPYELEPMVADAQWADFGTLSKRPGVGLMDTSALRNTIERIGGDRLIEDLPVRFGAVATDVRSRGSVLISRGSVADAVSASISVPGLFKPSRLDGHILVDGGLTQNLPIAAAQEMGATHVIAVRLAPEWDGLPQFRTSAQVHARELDSHVTLITPRVGGQSQWVPKGIQGVINLGREAAEHTLADYDVVSPRPDDLTPAVRS